LLTRPTSKLELALWVGGAGIAKLKLDTTAASLGLNPPGGELSIAPPDGFGVHEVDPAAGTGEVWPELTTKICLYDDFKIWPCMVT
jgi:hypothetical protein